jgi:predicted metal-dependent hydrolase
MTAAPVQAVRRPATARARTVRARRVAFHFEHPVEKHYVDNDIVMSHLTSVMSAGFPEGEEAFIRSVRFFRDQITDPVLKEQVAGFIGQEMTHGREHRNLNHRLHEMGYPTEEIDRRNGEILRRMEKFVPPIVALAMTAAAEHGTALLAENVLGRDEVQALAYDDEVRRLLNWHAFEELEHKAVAFDVYRAVGGPEWIRIGVMALSLLQTPLLLTQAMTASLSTDPAARNRVRVARGFVRLPRSPLFRHTLRRTIAYLRPGFHPDDIKTDALLEKWRAELFGAEDATIDREDSE